ncbi:GcvT family protein [Nocardioides soli]|uniref:Glycine cleavage system aminomethyltransferase T/glycine/D-amino acid oxidase-like deaminating enzyme n=1 Tax=Nocardioides soli TaxID=1036020 RepID=A0A7W4Z3H5_9ACTN|nr:FAD-dependent oxidoreductase [Nocardioides soli]MBB3045484.1 glycine cleavage system aminomethyltransferase T/glycine/D-amino acid oxidase-like deaminating enzyme [Nocardioides soli]
MATVPASAKVVVIGAGIVGNSLVHHLARLGWRDIVQIDKGPLPNPGGSTGHASNFIFPVDHSREITDLTLDSVRQYQEMGVFTQSGGFEIARTPERMEELRRRMSSARAWGIESELVDPAFVKEKVPFIEEDQFIGAFWTPSVGVVDSLRAGTIMRERALEAGALTVVPNAEVVGLDVEDVPSGRRIRRVRTDGGDIETEYVVIACGVWSPKIGDMAGISIPLTPAVHQMISVGPCPQLAEREGEISFPIVRDMDTFCYERQHGADMEVGSYAHRAILHEPEDIPSIEQAKLSPTEMPFTSDDFDPQLEQAYELMPELLGAEGAEMRYAINGLLSLTCDGNPILGESLVEGLWTAAAVWIKEGPGVGRAVAEWMVDGHSEIDVSHSDIRRFHPHQMRREHTRLRTTESFIKTYGIVHPSEQYESDRDQRLAAMHDSQVKLGAVFFETGGWERPHWYESNAPLLEEYGDAVLPREHEWDARWWSPIINAEHLRMREAGGVVDLSAFEVFDITGPGSLDAVQSTCVAQCDVPVGKVVYTPVLDGAGGFKADLTVMRLGDEHFRVVTGAAHGPADRSWFADHAGPDTVLTSRTDDIATIGLWGPRARDVLASLTSDDVSGEGFAMLTCREITVAGLPVLASRISYVGELGWELYVGVDAAAQLWDALLDAGSSSGVVPVGIGVYGTTGRIEKAYRAVGAELDAERTIVEAGMQRPKVKAADFTGREAYLAQRARLDSGEAPETVLCTMAVDDHTSASGVKRYMLGGEPILTRSGEPLTDGHGHHPYVTTAGSAPSLGKHLLMAYLPPEQARVGTELAVSYMEELYPVTVVSADATAPYDPANERMK